MADQVLAKLAVQIAANTAQFNSGLKSAQGQFKGFTSSITNAAKGLVAGFGLVEITKGVIDVTSKFQKFEAVLTNTLGSNSKAQQALKDIKEFALTTPFEVDEVTAAYVRWANQGLTPTTDKLRKIGDVASSLGAGFEQTAEAFKDLAVGQTKRIEEVGISAEAIKGTDKIRLAFKGVTTEIEKNAEGVQKALDTYSQLNGVLGASDAVSKTLGGRISNLSDAWTNLLLTIGNGTSGPLFAAVGALTNITNAIANLSKEMALIGQAISPFHDLRDVSKETLEYLIKSGRTDLGNRLSDVLKPFSDQAPIDFLKNLTTNQEAFTAALIKEGESAEDVAVLWDFYKKKVLDAAKAQRQAEKDDRLKEILKSRADALTAYNALQEKQLTGLNALKAKLKELNEVYDATNTNDNKRLNSISQEIQALEALIHQVESLKKVRADEVIARAPVSQGSIVSQFGIKAPTKEDTKKSVEDATKEFQEGQEKLAATTKNTGEEVKSVWIDVSQVVSLGVNAMTEAFQEANNGTISFGTAIIKGLVKFAKDFGKMLISLGVAALASKKIATNPYAAIAAGAVLLVIAGAAGAALKSSQGNYNSGASGRINGPGVSSAPLSININGEFTIQNGALKATINNQNIRDSRLGNGG